MGRIRGRRSNGSNDQTLAFSTGQAARYCFVTADTILNWINKGTLRAQRTVGGQYRILSTDLTSFMRDHGMNTALVESEMDVRPHCWEFHCHGQPDETCTSCIVHRSGAIRCHALRAEGDGDGAWRFGSCAECEYHARYSASGDTEE